MCVRGWTCVYGCLHVCRQTCVHVYVYVHVYGGQVPTSDVLVFLHFLYLRSLSEQSLPDLPLGQLWPPDWRSKLHSFMLAWQALYLMSHFPSPQELMAYSKSLPGSSLLEMEKSFWPYQPSITLRMLSLLLSLFSARDGAPGLGHSRKCYCLSFIPSPSSLYRPCFSGTLVLGPWATICPLQVASVHVYIPRINAWVPSTTSHLSQFSYLVNSYLE